MPSLPAARVGVALVALLVGVAASVGADMSAVPPVAAQAPTIGPTNTAAAETAAAGVTAIAATDAPPTPTPPVPPPPTPVLTPTPAVRPTPTGTPLSVSASRAPTILSSSGSAVAPGTIPPVASSGTGSSSPWPLIGVLIVVAAVVAAGIVGARIARRRSLGR